MVKISPIYTMYGIFQFRRGNLVSFSMNENSFYTCRVLLKIVPMVFYGTGREVPTYAVLDDGFTTTLVDTELANALGLVGPVEDNFKGGVTSL